MRRALPLLPSLVVGALLLAPAASGAPTATTADTAPRTSVLPSSRGHSGTCTTTKGVSVVVDARELGGSVLRRCALPDPGQTRFSGTGTEALRAAGVDVEGVQRYGLGVVCRLQGKPSAGTTLTVGGQPYREACRSTPPSGAYWSYWHASSPRSPWTVSTVGAAGRSVVNGGFEGWAFSLDRSPSLPPRLAPSPPSATAWKPYSAPLPRISGTARAGSTLKVTVGTWSPKPGTRTIRWYRDGRPISQATGSSYRVRTADRGRALTVKVTGSGSGRASTWAVSSSRTVAR